MSKKLLMNDFLNDSKLICWLDARDLKVGIPKWVDRKNGIKFEYAGETTRNFFMGNKVKLEQNNYFYNFNSNKLLKERKVLNVVICSNIAQRGVTVNAISFLLDKNRGGDMPYRSFSCHLPHAGGLFYFDCAGNRSSCNRISGTFNYWGDNITILQKNNGNTRVKINNSSTTGACNNNTILQSDSCFINRLGLNTDEMQHTFYLYSIYIFEKELNDNDINKIKKYEQSIERS